MRALVAAGADPNGSGSDGWPPLLHAVLSGDLDTIGALLDAGAAVDGRAGDGSTALLKACLWGKDEAVKLLLQHGADAAVTDEEGWTAARLAAAVGRYEIARLIEAATSSQRERTEPARKPHAAGDVRSTGPPLDKP